MAKKQGPQILDITVKEGGFRVNHCLLPEQIANIAHELQRAGIRYAEISHGCGAGSFKVGYPGLYPDEDLLKAARESAPEIKLCAFFAPSLHAVPEIERLHPYFDIGRVWVNVHEPMAANEHLKKFKALGKTAIAQIQRAHRVTPEQTAETAQQLSKMGADIIYLSDTFGSFSPNEVKGYLQAIRSKISLPLGFQGRNSTGRAVENSLTAWEGGAEWLDASVLGMGPGAGMTSLEILVALLQRQGFLEGIDLQELTFLGKWQVRPALHSLPQVRHIDVLFAKHRIDYYPENLLIRLAEILEVPLENLLVNLKKQSPDMIQLREAAIREYLAKEKLDWEVVLQFLKTGQIPN